jgi:AcrR family transcriptional regulator
VETKKTNGVSQLPISISSELKEKILNHARGRFLREGFAKISIDELTSGLSMSKKTFYQAFDSKDDLVEEIVQRKLAEINANMDRILSAETDFVHKLQEFIAYMGGVLSTMSKQMMSDMHKHQPQLWTRVETFRRERLTKNNVILLKQGMREGFIRDDVNAKIFIFAILASVEGVIQPQVLMNESFSSKEALSAIMDVFFRGILTDAGRTQLNTIQDSQSSTSR